MEIRFVVPSRLLTLLHWNFLLGLKFGGWLGFSRGTNPCIPTFTWERGPTSVDKCGMAWHGLPGVRDWLPKTTRDEHYEFLGPFDWIFYGSSFM